MKRCSSKNPATLYCECWEYVVACIMARCPHLRREEAEDISSQAFCLLLEKGVLNIQNWIWKGRMDGILHYSTQHKRYLPSGSLHDMKDHRYTETDCCEVFHPGQMLKRKDAKAAFALMMQGYNQAEVTEMLKRKDAHSVATMMFRLREKCKRYLKRDIQIYRNE